MTLSWAPLAIFVVLQIGSLVAFLVALRRDHAALAARMDRRDHDLDSKLAAHSGQHAQHFAHAAQAAIHTETMGIRELQTNFEFIKRNQEQLVEVLKTSQINIARTLELHIEDDRQSQMRVERMIEVMSAGIEDLRERYPLRFPIPIVKGGGREQAD